MEPGKRFYYLASPALLRVLTKGARAALAGGLSTARPATPVHYARLECAWLGAARESKCRRAKWESSVTEMVGSKIAQVCSGSGVAAKEKAVLLKPLKTKGPALLVPTKSFLELQTSTKYRAGISMRRMYISLFASKILSFSLSNSNLGRSAKWNYPHLQMGLHL